MFHNFKNLIKVLKNDLLLTFHFTECNTALVYVKISIWVTSLEYKCTRHTLSSSLI